MGNKGMDITKCTNHKCKLAKNCWRYNSPSNELNQSYAFFTPTVDEKTGNTLCEYFRIKPKEK